MGALAAILFSVGAPILGQVIEKSVGGIAGAALSRVIGALAKKFSGAPETEEALVDLHNSEPLKFTRIAREVEEENRTEWLNFLTVQGAYRASLFEREDKRESWYMWAWRPTLSWLLIVLWLWNALLQPLAVALGSQITAMPYDSLVAFSGLWLAIYGGGHTIKSIMGK